MFAEAFEEAEAAVEAEVVEVVEDVVAKRDGAAVGAVLVPAACVVAVAALACVTYAQRYALMLWATKALDQWEANDPNFPSKQLRWQQLLDEEVSKREALNEEWLERLQAEKAKTKANADEMQQRIEEERALALDMRANATALETEFRALIDEQRAASGAREEELHGRIVEEQAKFASLSAEAGSLREQISSLEAQLTRKSDSSNDLKEELLSARRAEEVVKSELAGVCAAKDALARQLDEVRTNLTWETSKASELEEQLSALKSELASARDARAELERELEGARANLAVESSNEHELEEQLSALKSELASARDARVELERELEGARANLAVESSNEHELEEQLSALKSELASARDARVELERELDAMRDGFEAQLEAQKGAGADMKLESERLEELVAKLKNEIEANSVLRERMQTEKQAEDSYVTALNEEIEALRLELHAAQAHAAQALGQYAELDSALPKIIDAVDRLRSLTSMVNEDSPIVEHTFSVADVPPPQPNEFLVIVGSWNDWDLATGVAMSYDPDGSWKALVELQSDIVYEYKVCVCSGSDEERVPQAWQSGANSAFAIASSLINEQGLAPKATVMSHWVADPANAPIMMFGPDGEKFTLSSTQLMTDLPANLITDTLEDLSHVISEVTRGIDNDILNTKQHAATASR
ncbi:predicted protein [Ostreococcus lucimarinus CCE9901]|uniref:CBM20 domain-containing protein n=1 Tax=Ostreococcus lucimarinus (strain CCE9901) TaxID=436017 RepID=A4S2Y2_OSTLU|nr:predicted protein [Ostreococcus lucimarinus CCE9901]ABO97909.1 predicted protein [Ostreococcus lucimarinus CCE9901]|eukprot:XP_001419616.1 predicted protein [Ostreococcus lucimarinus CCE9901]